MRIVSWTILASLSLASLASAQSAQQRIPVNGAGDTASAPASIAYTPDPAIAAVVSAVMPKAIVGMGAVKGAPFSATQTTVREQTLSDGTVIKSSVDVLLSRDSEGRVRAESTLNHKSSDAQQTHVVAVWNPVERTEMSWVSGSQSGTIATVLHLPEMQLNGMMAVVSAPPPPPAGTLSRSMLAAPASSAGQNAANIKTEALPADSIAGLEVTGTRTTQVVPTGTIDNDRDFTVTSEAWFSPELKITMRQLTSDPRTGTVTTDLTNIDRSEPDTALFKPPAGSRLMDLPDPTAAGSGAKR